MIMCNSFVLFVCLKLYLDKYYTQPDLAEYCVNKTKEIIGSNNISEYLEPSAGTGVFLQFLDKPYLAYDIEPFGNNIEKQDYLKLQLPYKIGRCVIGNPPYGKGNYKSVQFFSCHFDTEQSMWSKIYS